MERDSKIIVPILLIGFNRPDTIDLVFNQISKVKPLKLYVAIDGPRLGKTGEIELVEEVKKIVSNVNWPCETHYRFNNSNEGAEITVSSAISWVFENEEFVIILEDDILASLSFFTFAQEMLFKYENNNNIWRVTGVNYFPSIKTHFDADYFFAKWGISWGWATWKRVWNKYNLYVDIPKIHTQKYFLKTISSNKDEMYYYKYLFSEMRNKGIGNNTWDFIALYLRRIYGGVDIVPKKNLISNIGEYGLHAKGNTIHHNRPIDDDFVIQKHPPKIVINIEYDKAFFNNFRKLSLKQQLIRKLKSIIK